MTAVAYERHADGHYRAGGPSANVRAYNDYEKISAPEKPDMSVVRDNDKDTLFDRGCEGAPEIFVEVVSPSNPKMDYVFKLNLYREAGEREDWICNPQRERTLVYAFGSEAVMAPHPFDQPVSSEVLPSLTIDFSAIVANM